MLSTCYHCHAKLGANEALEALPIGRRIAYDGERGRVWVICGKCARWNLTPFEERWEALEQAERLYRGTRARVSTDNIALAKTKEGTELVRIGRPLRPEFAAWRYGELLQKRLTSVRRSTAIYVGSVVAFSQVGQRVLDGSALMRWGDANFGAFMIGGAAMLAGWFTLIRRWEQSTPVFATELRVDDDPHGPRRLFGVSLPAIRDVRLAGDASAGEALGVAVRAAEVRSGSNFIGRRAWRAVSPEREFAVTGDDSHRLLRMVLPAMPMLEGRAHDVEDAVRVVESTTQALSVETVLRTSLSGRGLYTAPDARLDSLPPARRLAAEIVLAEADEHRLAQGELAELYGRWEEAERIAAIADGGFGARELQDEARAVRGADAPGSIAD